MTLLSEGIYSNSVLEVRIFCDAGDKARVLLRTVAPLWPSCCFRWKSVTIMVYKGLPDLAE